ncbi:MAG: Fe-S protein assembly co-chaperone HscB [Acidobacteriaceae bacterium]|nr:Fe-S protein assembly co-chaperone HscB [Acidobacteriaceae bacterium]
MRAAHFCNACGKVQPAAPTDYFSFFGLARKLNIDLPTLEREFYRLSRKLHPDLYVLTTDQEQSWSLEKSSQLNDAYRTLKDPISRTAYLLRLEGVQLEEQSQEATRRARETGQEKKQVVPPDLLEEVFELNMQLEELKMNKQMGDQDEDLNRQIREAEKNFRQKLDASTAELKKMWDEWDALPSDDHDGHGGERARVRDRMVDLLNRRKYLMNLVAQVEEAIGH